MNKALHAIVYVILVLAGAALYFEMNIFEKRSLQNDSITQLADYIVKISHTIEKADAAKPSTVPEARRDISLYESLGFVEYGRNPRGFRSRLSGWQTLVLMRLELA